MCAYAAYINKRSIHLAILHWMLLFVSLYSYSLVALQILLLWNDYHWLSALSLTALLWYFLLHIVCATRFAPHPGVYAIHCILTCCRIWVIGDPCCDIFLHWERLGSWNTPYKIEAAQKRGNTIYILKFYPFFSFVHFNLYKAYLLKLLVN